jgi:hypothetical protein
MPTTYLPTEFTFSDPLWADIEWLLFTYDNDPGAPVVGFDRLTLSAEFLPSAPEPASVTVLCVGLIAFASCRRTLRQ